MQNSVTELLKTIANCPLVLEQTRDDARRLHLQLALGHAFAPMFDTRGLYHGLFR